MTNTLLLLLYFSMPVMIYAAPQLDILQGVTGGGVPGVGPLNGGLGPVSNTVAGGGVVAYSWWSSRTIPKCRCKVGGPRWKRL
ncbi:hypothetical protein AGABI1DRAFT_115432, partial [Agaricus bisporus var. burnettii JB137-S8]